MNRALLISALLFATASDAEPVVTAYNGYSVTIQNSSLDEAKNSPETDAEADRICKAGGKGRAEHASSHRVLDTYVDEHLYLCLN